MHTANKFAKSLFILHSHYHALVYKALDGFPRLLSVSLNAELILARGVDGGPTSPQHWSFVKGESLVY